MDVSRRLSGKAVITVLAFVILACLVFGTGSYLGLFSRPTLTMAIRGPYTIFGLKHARSYRYMDQNTNEMLVKIEADGLFDEIDRMATVLYDEPGRERRGNTQTMAGFIARNPDIIPSATYEVEQIPKREVLLATIRSHPSIAMRRSRSRINGWLEQNGRAVAGLPLQIEGAHRTVEIEIPLGN